MAARSGPESLPTITTPRTPLQAWRGPPCLLPASSHGRARRSRHHWTSSSTAPRPAPPAALQPAAAPPLLPLPRCLAPQRPAGCPRGMWACCGWGMWACRGRQAASLARHSCPATHRHRPPSRPCCSAAGLLPQAARLGQQVAPRRHCPQRWVLSGRAPRGCRPCPAWRAAAAPPALHRAG